MTNENDVVSNTSLTLRRLGSSRGLICNQRVGGSNPPVGSEKWKGLTRTGSALVLLRLNAMGFLIL
jgi:hypothetical protein